MWPFRRNPPRSKTVEIDPFVLRLLEKLTEALIQKDTDMLALLQSIRADVDALKAEVANIQANAAAKAELDASFPIAQSIQADIAALKTQLAPPVA